MPTISFTKLEIDCLLDAASNMKDDFEDYFSFLPDVKKRYAAYNSAMSKLAVNRPDARVMTPLEEQAHDSINDN